MRAPIRLQQGFSLLELVIVMVLTGLLAVMAMQPILRAIQARTTVANNLSAIDALRYATERIVRELRQVQYNAQGTGFQLAAISPIAGTISASNGLCFTRVGGNAGSSYASVAIRQSGTQATLDNVTFPGCAAVAPHALANNVSTLRFDYWSYGSGSAPIALALNDASFGS